MKTSIINEAKSAWQVITKGSSPNAQIQFELEVHKKLLNIFQVGDYYYMIFNIPETKLDFVSPHTEAVLGVAPANFTLEYLLENIHPDDHPYFLNFEHFVADFFSKLTVEKICNYKVRYDYRIRKSNGDYIRILQQVVTIEHDENGAVLRTLCVHTDISHLKENSKPVLSIIGLEGEPSYINIDVAQKYIPSAFLSPRDRQIINLLIDGKLSKEIAFELSLTLQTVETYRKTLLKKTNTKTTAELIGKVIREGWV